MSAERAAQYAPNFQHSAISSLPRHALFNFSPCEQSLLSWCLAASGHKAVSLYSIQEVKAKTGTADPDQRKENRCNKHPS